MRNTRLALTAFVASILLAGCQSTADWMASTQPKAVQAAETRGRFELNCPAAKGTVLSEQDVAGAQAYRYRGPDRAVFTVSVRIWSSLQPALSRRRGDSEGLWGRGKSRAPPRTPPTRRRRSRWSAGRS